MTYRLLLLPGDTRHLFIGKHVVLAKRDASHLGFRPWCEPRPGAKGLIISNSDEVCPSAAHHKGVQCHILVACLAVTTPLRELMAYSTQVLPKKPCPERCCVSRYVRVPCLRLSQDCRMSFTASVVARPALECRRCSCQTTMATSPSCDRHALVSRGTGLVPFVRILFRRQLT